MNLKHFSTVVCLLAVWLPTQVLAQSVVTDSLGVRETIATSPAELLRGEVSGVRVSSIDGNPNGALNVNIRGLNTLRGDSQPLWIVDGAVIGSSVNHNLEAFYLHGGTTSRGSKLPDYSGQSYTSPVNNFWWLDLNNIESLEVIKDVSATALYGMSGANGVVIVKTKKSLSGTRNIYLSTNVGADFASQKGEAFGNGLRQVHRVAVNGAAGNNSYYNISGFFKQNTAAIKATNSIFGGLAANFQTMANQVFKFGLDANLSYGNYTSTGGGNYIGAPSTMMSSRYPDLFPQNTVSGWLNSYYDQGLDYRMVNSVWLQMDIVRGLNVRLSGGMDYQNQTRYIWFGNDTSFGKLFTGAASILNNFLFAYNAKGEVNFTRNFAVKHHVEVSAAFDLQGNANKTNAMCGTDFDLTVLRGKGLSSSGSQHAIQKLDRNYTQFGAYAHLGYDFDSYAGVDATVRFDKTARFDSDMTLFPSANAYVNIKKIVLPQSDVLSTLKVTGGYGSAGREVVLPYEHLAQYISVVPTVETGGKLYHEGLNRLVSTEYNVGLAFGFMNDRINFALKYYDKTTDDSFKIYNFGKVLANLWVETTNSSVIEDRVSSISNKGFEIDADFRIIQSKNVTWSLYANASMNTNSVVSLDELDAFTPGIVKKSYTAANAEGSSVSQAYGYKENEDPTTIPDKITLLGNTIPKYVGGFGTTLKLYGVTLEAMFSGAGGFNIVNANKVVEAGRDYISETDLEKGNYLRLDNLSLSYDIPLNVKWIKNFRVNLAARNLFTITEYSGWNPDVNSFGVTARGNGVDYGSFPVIRSIILGVTLNF
jgi:TonB-dependent SusC/RagA subfamily outer membrane receptor